MSFCVFFVGRQPVLIPKVTRKNSKNPVVKSPKMFVWQNIQFDGVSTLLFSTSCIEWPSFPAYNVFVCTSFFRFGK